MAERTGPDQEIIYNGVTQFHRTLRELQAAIEKYRDCPCSMDMERVGLVAGILHFQVEGHVGLRKLIDGE